MLHLDSCFIVELLRKCWMEELRDVDDPIFKFDHIQSSLQRDLMLFENQLPFFILLRFFEMTENFRPPTNIIHMALCYFSQGTVLQAQHLRALGTTIRMGEIKHLLGLVHYCYCSQFRSMLSERNSNGIPSSEEDGMFLIRGIKHLLGLVRYPFQSMCIADESENDRFVKSVTELKEAGIKFKEVEGRILFDIRFENGTMEIPRLTFDDFTESLFRNLIAYEQYHSDSSWHHFTKYQEFMDCLINSSKDVEILRHKGIIENNLGDDEAISSIVNKLVDNVNVSPPPRCYSGVLKDLNLHCRRRRYLWMAKLRRDYFNTPWALISFVAAVVLLLLTVTQTIFTIISVV